MANVGSYAAPPKEYRTLHSTRSAKRRSSHATIQAPLGLELLRTAYGESRTAARPQEYRVLHSAKSLRRTSSYTTSQALPVPLVRSNSAKRLSTPAPLSRSKSERTSERPPPFNPRHTSAAIPSRGYRVTSFQSTASAPAVLVSTPLAPSDPPSQYNPLQHYIPCVIESCTKTYTPSLLGPTFYLPQQPYQLLRKRALCSWHANQDLKLANHKAKCMFEGMRQNCGRKTLGQIAAEFEMFVQQCREDRAIESEMLEARQKKIVLGTTQTESAKGKHDTDAAALWDWRFTPRPCTKKACTKQWYSPFDGRLFLFYHTARPSGLRPLTTMCPSCAREDVESAEERIRERGVDAGEGPEWVEWCKQVEDDRKMEEEFWMHAQERVVREKAVTAVAAAERKETGSEKTGDKKTRKKSDRLKGVCVVM